MCEAEGFNIFLQARRHLSLISPEAVACELMPHIGKHALDFAEFLSTLGGCLQSAGTVAFTSTTIPRPLRRVVRHDSVQEEDGLLREVRNIAAMLLRYVETGMDEAGGVANLYEALSPIIVIVEFVPETLEDGENGAARGEIRGRRVRHRWQVLAKNKGESEKLTARAPARLRVAIETQ